MDKQKKIRELIAAVAGKVVTVEADENLFDSGIIDSFALTDLVAALEKEFQIQVPDGDLNPRKFASIEKIEEYLEARA
jgi:acyl carrier protein